jgi:diguanylate cyclase (GGDEF)-like protein
MRRKLIRLTPLFFLLLQISLRAITSEPSAISDLIFFNLAALTAGISIFFSPLFNDRLAVLSLALAVIVWAIGSAMSTEESFYQLGLWSGYSDIAYAIFYPLALFGLIRAISNKVRVQTTELLDVAIIGLGATSVLASLLLQPAMVKFEGTALDVFLAILYPIGDLVLLAIALILTGLRRISLRTLLILLGFAIFAATDLYFLWKSATSGYEFAALTDDGWVLGLILIAESLWHQGGEKIHTGKAISVLSLLSLLISGTLLIFAALRPESLPRFVLIPALGTITLSFLRLAIALRDAREIHDERELARTDELTGLANRRRFISALDNLGFTTASLLLLDLDGFKKVNDTLGHEAGDQLLKVIAVRFARQVPRESIIARLGGDEFGVIVYGKEAAGMEVAHALRSSLTYPVQVADHGVTVGVSIGVVVNDGEPELMRRADQAMYLAKKEGSGISVA